MAVGSSHSLISILLFLILPVRIAPKGIPRLQRMDLQIKSWLCSASLHQMLSMRQRFTLLASTCGLDAICSPLPFTSYIHYSYTSIIIVRPSDEDVVSRKTTFW